VLSATEAKVAAFMAVFDHGATTRLFYHLDAVAGIQPMN
jgi:hypothetical protein